MVLPAGILIVPDDRPSKQHHIRLPDDLYDHLQYIVRSDYRYPTLTSLILAALSEFTQRWEPPKLPPKE